MPSCDLCVHSILLVHAGHRVSAMSRTNCRNCAPHPTRSWWWPRLTLKQSENIERLRTTVHQTAICCDRSHETAKVLVDAKLAAGRVVFRCVRCKHDTEIPFTLDDLAKDLP